jgi:hypothetical protein
MMNNPVFLESDKSIAYSHGKILKTEEDLSNGSSDLCLIQQMAAGHNSGCGIEESLNKICLVVHTNTNVFSVSRHCKGILAQAQPCSIFSF